MIALATVGACDVAQLTNCQQSLEMARYHLRSIRLLNQRLAVPTTCADDITILLVVCFTSADCEVFVEVRAYYMLSSVLLSTKKTSSVDLELEKVD
jgi:hypothetical protein